MNFISRAPLKTILIIAFTGLIIISTTVISIIYFTNTRKTVNEVAALLKDEITLRITEHVSEYLDLPHKLNRLNAQLIRSGSINPENRNMLAAHFRDQIEIFDSVSSLNFGNTSGGLVNSGREPGSDERYFFLTESSRRGKIRKIALDEKGDPGRVILTLSDFDATKRAWYISADEAKSAVWSSIFILFTGQDMSIAASRPVFNSRGSFAGVVSVEIFLSQLNSYLKSLNIGTTGEAFIIERSGDLVASSDSSLPFLPPGNGISARRLQALDSPNPVISGAVESFISSNKSFVSVLEPENHEFSISSSRYFMNISPIRDSYGIDWLACVIVAESDFLGEIEANNRKIALLITFILIVSVILVIYGADKITTPIITLSTILQSILGGEWRKPQFGRPVSKEVTELTISFTHLYELLQDTLERLNLKIEQQKRTEKALRQSESELFSEKERLSLALIAGRTGIWEIKHPDKVYYNDTWYTMLGYEPGELPAEYITWKNLLHPDDAESIEQSVQENFKKGTDFSINFRLKSKSGEWRWIQSIAKITDRTNDGEPARTIGTHTDITEKKLAEDALAEEKERLEVTLKSIGDGVIAVDNSGRITLMNRVAEELTGWQQQEGMGRDLSEVFKIKNELTGKPAENPVDRVLKSGITEELENHTILISRSGNERIIADSAAPIKSADGVIIGVVLVFRDMTEKQKLLDANIKTQKLESLGILAGGIAHDFNNLLSGIYGYMDLAKRTSEESRTRGYLEKSINTILRARDLTNQLLTFARGGAPERKTESLAPVIEETARFSLSGSSILLTIDLPEDLYYCDFDRNQIAQVIDNLIINAKQAMPGGGNLTIRGENLYIKSSGHSGLPEGSYVKLTFTDSGKGIKKEILPKIFDPFFSTKKGGSGLGLTTSYSIINRHGGTIEIESAVGKGSTFTIYLPASENKKANEEENHPVEFKGSGNILVVDDEDVIRDSLGALLEMIGYSIVLADDGFQALRNLKDAHDGLIEPFKAVILDLTIPGGMGGIDTIEIIRKLYPALPVFVSSGYAENPVMSDPVKFGFTASIKKPFTFDELSAILKKNLG